jgi:hypothetical protein
MMYEISSTAVVDGEPEQVWAVLTDVARWPDWDPHEQAARLDGPFAAGSVGWSKPHGAPAATWRLTEVLAGRRWASECSLPGGTLRGVNTVEPAGPGRTVCTKTMRVTGPLVPLFRIWFGPRIRRDLARTWTALQSELRAEPQARPAAGTVGTDRHTRRG